MQKLNHDAAAEIKDVMMNGGTSKDAEKLAQKFGCSLSAIYHIKAGTRWKEVGYTKREDGEKFNPNSWHFKRMSFWDRVEIQTEKISNGCHIFTGNKDDSGYGRISKDGKLARVHRAVWERANGTLPSNFYVCHKCDTPACINIDHLFVGTHDENMRDKKQKGRGRTRFQKLLPSDVSEIRILLARGVSGAKIAKLYGVSGPAISHIKHRKKWKSVS